MSASSSRANAKHLPARSSSVACHALEIALVRHKSAPSPNLQPQLFPESFAFLQTLEELFQNAYNDGVYANAFLFSPLLQRKARL